MSQELLEELANAVAAAMRRISATATVVVDLPARRVRITDAGTLYEVFLGNAYEEYVRATPAQRPAIVAKYANLDANKVAPPSAEDWKRLLPKLMPRRERELLKLRFDKVENLTTGLAVAGGALLLELAIDLPQTIRMVSASDLAAANLTEAAAFETARQNLRGRSYQAWKELAPGLYRSPWADFFDGARLALPDLFANIGVKGDAIVTLPNRCTMLLTGSDETEGLKYLYPATRMLAKEERPLHPGALRLDGGVWRALGDADMDLFAISHELLFLSSLQDALDHQVVGDHVVEKLRARGQHIEPLHILDREDTPLMTLTKLPPVANSIVPRADLVMCSDDMIIAWYKFEAMLGADLVPIEGVWPAYYEMKRRPSSAEIAAAKAQ